MKTVNGRPMMLRSDNLSIGWGQVMDRLLKPGVERILPLTLSISGFNADGEAAEVPEIREALDRFLAAQGKRDTENVAWTIFPKRYWELAEGKRDAFFDLFIDSFQRVQEANPRNNKRGSYFQRLVDLHGEGRGPNQLKWMLDDYHAHPKARRTSKFQASTFDPMRDYTSAGQLEFPCLQQVSFVVDEGELVMNGFYATQQIARKGYGNYLGLSRLGAFMAQEMGLHFKQLNVFVGLASIDISRRSDPDLLELMQVVRRYLPSSDEVPAA